MRPDRRALSRPAHSRADSRSVFVELANFFAFDIQNSVEMIPHARNDPCKFSGSKVKAFTMGIENEWPMQDSNRARIAGEGSDFGVGGFSDDGATAGGRRSVPDTTIDKAPVPRSCVYTMPQIFGRRRRFTHDEPRRSCVRRRLSRCSPGCSPTGVGHRKRFYIRPHYARPYHERIG